MRLFRAPRTSRKWGSATDVLKASDWRQPWKPGVILQLDATIDKKGERHTDVGVELEPDDIVTAMISMVAYYRSETERLTGLCNALQRGMASVVNMARWDRDSAGSDEALVRGLLDLAVHYHLTPLEDPPVAEWEEFKEADQ